MNKKEIAETFLKLASAGKVSEAFEKYIHSDFIHHNAYFKGDRETLMQGMAENAKQFPNKKYETLRTLADGDLVAVHGKVTLAPDSQWSVIHIFRFSAKGGSASGGEGDKIIEEWEASQEVIKDSPNEHGIF